MVMLLFFTIAAAAASQAEAHAAVSHSIFVCGADGLPTVVLDYHDDHRMVRYAQLGENEASFYLIDPDFNVISQRSGPERSWRITAIGPMQHALGFEAGIQASVELTIRVGADNRPSYSYVIRAEDWVREEADCLSPPAPPTHLPEQIR